MNKNNKHIDNISLFVITVNEYKEFNKLFINNNVNEYLNIKTKAMLIRKYITRNDNVHIGKIIDELIIKYREEEKYLKALKNNYIEVYHGSIIQIDSLGNEYNQIEVFEDIIYGLYLHADAERVERLQNSDNSSKMYMLNEFIIKIETVILELYQFISDRLVIYENKELPLEKATVIRSKEIKNMTGLLREGYWGNLIGEKIVSDYFISERLDYDDIKVKKVVMNFLDFFQYERASYQGAKKYIFKPILKDWGDFSETKKYILNLGSNIGYSNRIVYNNKKNVAWMTIFKNVDYAFVIDTPQLVEVTIITLVKNSLSKWKIFSIGKVDNPFNERE